MDDGGGVVRARGLLGGVEVADPHLLPLVGELDFRDPRVLALGAPPDARVLLGSRALQLLQLLRQLARHRPLRDPHPRALLLQERVGAAVVEVALHEHPRAHLFRTQPRQVGLSEDGGAEGGRLLR